MTKCEHPKWKNIKVDKVGKNEEVIWEVNAWTGVKYENKFTPTGFRILRECECCGETEIVYRGF